MLAVTASTTGIILQVDFYINKNNVLHHTVCRQLGLKCLLYSRFKF